MKRLRERYKNDSAASGAESGSAEAQVEARRQGLNAIIEAGNQDKEGFGAWLLTLDDNNDQDLINGNSTELRERYERDLAALRAEFSDADSDLGKWHTSTNNTEVSNLEFSTLTQYKKNFEDAVKSLRSELAGTPDADVESMGYKDLIALKAEKEAKEALAAVRPVTVKDIEEGVFINRNRTETLADRMGTNLGLIEKAIGHGITQGEFDQLRRAVGQFVAMAPRANHYNESGLKRGEDGGFLNRMKNGDGYMGLLQRRGLIA